MNGNRGRTEIPSRHGPLTRREFLRWGIASGSVLLLPGEAFCRWSGGGTRNVKSITTGDAPAELWKWSRAVYYQEALKNGFAKCLTCPNECVLPPGGRSRCRSHVNREGKIHTLVYGNPCAVHIDPVEKKPLYHFLPGSSTFSVATTGCSFNCLNCQNWEISQARPEDVDFEELFPGEVVASALRGDCRSVAYTYTEATTFFEYMIDTARIARSKGVRNLWVTNGYIRREPLLDLCSVLDGANVDIKGFSGEVYRDLMAGKLEPVLETLEILKEKGVWFELTALIVPTYTDDMGRIREMCRWILDRLGPDVPLHFSRFYPRYRLTHLPPAAVPFLADARKEAMGMGLRYVYVGNVPPGEWDDTVCPSCGKTVVRRRGYRILENGISGGKCAACGTPVAGVWQ
ncbi:MAG TPA: AmmeMemoRadiSam system radical SAM enzyme [Syntrophales bacterium]|nr:AmmeMemoRadiSam system radical SAM enzyme [Syntrophales bacterium]HQN78348.1 AmmeMemoRadiSam system radical SAM enzyme [Syntrophales bacterium]HQQ28016.1 AmmeMemoRadiSam system radical SAM enzyme [Syntrophales bacterium]